MGKFAILGVTYPDNVTLTVTITGITHNEATQTKRGDKPCPDASIARQQIRIERDGTSVEKNGRTYRATRGRRRQGRSVLQS